jgi:hypothetical protein
MRAHGPRPCDVIINGGYLDGACVVALDNRTLSSEYLLPLLAESYEMLS